ncbi:MAG TPA: DHH family phosphoesterase [Thermoplasmatales archaeon]|nr:DHH family phosphoesterase [Thermoplasmatales archaeon]
MMEIEKTLKDAANLLLSFSKTTTVRVISHYDTDGITAAAILCKALDRKGYGFHVTLLKHPFKEELSKLKKEDNEIIIFSDLGSGQLDMIEELGCPAIILDHHQPEKREINMDSIIQINSNMFGIDGNYEISGAGMSYMFAKELDGRNKDLSVLALTGAIGDKQHLGGFRGLNRDIFDEAKKEGLIQIGESELKVGDDSMEKEITLSIDPFYPGLSGREERVREMLNSLHIDPEKRYHNLTVEERRKLHSELYLRLLRNNLQPEIIDEVVKERLKSRVLPISLERFSDTLDACGKSGETGLALSLCLDIKRFYEQAKKVENEYKKHLLSLLVNLENEGLKETDTMKYFYSPRASIGSVMSGIVMNYFPCGGKPVFSITDKNGKIHVSCRATRELVDKGLDLGAVMRAVASKLGGSGGGHKIAAGGTFENVSSEELLSTIDKLLG